MLSMSMEFLGFRVTSASTGRHALEIVARHAPDLVMLEVILPDVHRLRRLPHHARQRRDGTGALPQRPSGGGGPGLHALDLGGDDFVAKPFDLAVVAARVRALLRRGAPAPARATRLAAGPVELNLQTRETWWEGAPVRLTATEFALLHCLMANAGRVLPRLEIQERIWHHREKSGALDTYVYCLRHKLGDSGQTVIRTVRGVGYVLR